MWFRRKWNLVFILIIILALPCSAFCGPNDKGESPAAFPRVNIPEPTYTFEPVVEGQDVVHDFVIQNTGTKTLDITKVRPG